MYFTLNILSEGLDTPDEEEEDKEPEMVSAITPLAVDDVFKNSKDIRLTNEVMGNILKKGSP